MNAENKIVELSRQDSSFRFYRKYLKDNSDIRKYVCDTLETEPWFETHRLLMICVSRGIKSPIKCTCGNPIDVRSALKGKRFCSCMCSNGNEEKKEKERCTNRMKYGCDYSTQSSEINAKREKTLMKHYGVDSPQKSSAIRKRTARTVLAKYGMKCVLQNDEIKRRIAETNVKKYGNRCSLHGKEIEEKTKDSMLRMYGVEHALQSNDVMDRMKSGNLAKYGVENPAQLESVKRKARKTSIKRYGVENPAQCNEVKEKIRQTNMDRYGSENYMLSDEYRKKSFTLLKKFSDYVSPMFEWTEWYGWNAGKAYKWKCARCGKEFQSGIHCFEINGVRMPRCLSCHPFLGNGNGSSIYEQELIEFVKSIYNGSVVHGDRTQIRPLELDIYLPEKNVAIEFDGLYWHSEKNGKDEYYHLMKTEKCLGKGIRLIHVFEDEWKEKREIVKDRIRSILGINQTRIFARKCIVRELDSKTANEFLDANHLQGCCNSSIRYGLFHNDELVSVMTFGKPRFNRNYDWELVRYASKIGCSVVGGASKLLASFRKGHSGSIVSYADRRYSDGHLYERLGFVLEGASKPNYWYVKGTQKLNRYACQKHKLPALLGDGYDEGLSECDNMVANGWSQVHDCGNFIYVID